MTEKTALVIGATGGIGGEVARVLLRRGWSVKGLTRGEPKKSELDALGIEWVRGDALDHSAVFIAAMDTNLIFHGANPPSYKNWPALVLPMLENTIAAAKTTGARVVLPGTIYNFGPDAFPVLRETSPQHPKTRKGAIRVQMEDRLKEESANGVPCLIVRAGDFFGPRLTENSWFRQLVKPRKPIRSVTYPGDPSKSHAWAYLPDFAETIVQLVEKENQLRKFEVFHFAGHWFEKGVEIAEAVRQVAGAPNAPIKSFPWFLIRTLSPVVPLFRELTEMRYLWFTSQRLDNSRLLSILGKEPHTPLRQAVQETLVGLGCL